jgi:hypothetical protein
MTTSDNRGADDGGTTTVEPAVVAAVVAPEATPPPPPLTAMTATPRGPSTSTPGPAPFRCGPSAVGRPDLHAAPGPSTSDGVDTMDELLGPAAIGPLLPHHGDGSFRGHLLGHRFRRLQPHHFQCW